MNQKKKPVQPHRVICFLLLLFIIAPEFSLGGDYLRKFRVRLSQPSDFLAKGANGGLNFSNSGPAASTTSLNIISSSATDCNVQDSGFEEETPNPYWSEHSTNFDTPIAFFDPDLAGHPHSGNWFAWFGGTGLKENGWVEQNVGIPAGDTATLDFYLEITYAENPGYLRVFLDGDQLFEAIETDINIYNTYSQVLLDVSDYADGDFHLLRFESTTEAGDGVTNFFVDDICVTITTPNKTSRAMPWIPLLLLD